jgi:dihydroorotate dehydrogenase electron transfer subunit
MDDYPLSGSLNHTGVVTRNDEVRPTCWWLEIRCPELAREARPGQFVMLRCGRALDPLLSRAFSICDVVHEAGEPVGIVVLQVVIGVGTEALSHRQAGEQIGLLGPLGRPYDLGSPDEHMVMVAGGVGAAPFLLVARALRDRSPDQRVTYLIGARSHDWVYLADEIRALGCDVLVATDDGSAGHHGYVTDLLDPLLDDRCRVLACGPNPMFKALASVVANARSRGLSFPCQVSTEETMPCGYGACAGCVVPVHADDTPEGFRWVKSCVEGPVFDVEAIRWEMMRAIH